MRKVTLACILGACLAVPLGGLAQDGSPQPTPPDSRQKAAMANPSAQTRPNAVTTMPRPKGAPPRPRFDERPRGLFRKLDANRDGRISQEEMEKAPLLFKRFDTNEDGVIAWDRSFRPMPMKRKTDAENRDFFKKLDKNDDTKLTSEEFSIGQQRFQEMDTDGDGVLIPDEFAAGMRKEEDRLDRESKEDQSITLSILESLDSDKDQKITAAEFKEAKRFLAERDTNSKGFATREDLLRFSAQESPTTTTLTLPR